MIRPLALSDFDTKVEVISLKEAQSKRSVYGNNYISISPSDIQKLQDGKILYFDDDEYGTFIVLKGESL